VVLVEEGAAAFVVVVARESVGTDVAEAVVGLEGSVDAAAAVVVALGAAEQPAKTMTAVMATNTRISRSVGRGCRDNAPR
jgi:hypothetical protein